MMIMWLAFTSHSVPVQMKWRQKLYNQHSKTFMNISASIDKVVVVNENIQYIWYSAFEKTENDFDRFVKNIGGEFQF